MPTSDPSPPPHRLLPANHPSTVWEVRIDGVPVRLDADEYPNGRLGGIRISAPTTGESLQTSLHALSEAVTVALQHDIPLDRLMEHYALEVTASPRGRVSGSDTVAWAMSIYDYVFRELAVHYLGRTDLQNKRGSALSPVIPFRSKPKEK